MWYFTFLKQHGFHYFPTAISTHNNKNNNIKHIGLIAELNGSKPEHFETIL